ncbi:stage II sporulation protein M [Chloroflexota bacterium]
MSYKWWLLISTFLFGIGLALGVATPTGIDGLLAEDSAALEEFADLLGILPQSSVLLIIFAKNVSAILISFALSPIFCLVPLMALTFNGWLLGLVSTTVIQEKSLGYLLAGVLPHGIFELPAFIIGEAVALSFGTAVILALFKEERRNLLLPDIRRNLRYLVVAISLLLPAAIIETYVTPLFLS